MKAGIEIEILVRFVSLAWGKRVGRAGDLQGGRGVGEFSVTKRQEVDEVGIDDRLDISVSVSLLVLWELNFGCGFVRGVLI